MRRFLFAFILCLLPLSPAGAQAFPEYKWVEDRVCVQKHFDSYYGVNNAIEQWNSVAAGPTFYRAAHCPYWHSVHVFKAWKATSRWAGITQPYLNGNYEIIRVIIRLNNWTGHTLPRRQLYTLRRFVATHEFGHALGLQHNNSVGSVMCYDTDWRANNGDINWYDRRSVRQLYT